MSGKNDNPAKKYRSKWTRIAVEGATTDGRTIERSWIEDMASTYSPNTYGARINCEHIKGYLPKSDFGAYGDVLALKSEEVEIAGAKKLALLAQLQPNDMLLALNKAGQKIYTSIEVQPKFADSGKAYLVGLAVTDTPASLGTEALSFSAQHGTMTTGLLGMNLIDLTQASTMEKLVYFSIVFVPVSLLTFYTVIKSRRLSLFLDALSNEGAGLRYKLAKLRSVWVGKLDDR